MAIAVVVVILTSLSVYSQVRSGTIVVFTVSQKEAVIAADSRATYFHRPPDDDQCKIATFRGHLVFAVTSAARYIKDQPFDPSPAWDAIDEAKRAADANGGNIQMTSSKEVDTVADTWSAAMQADWNALYTWHPQLVIDMARKDKGDLTNGIFIDAKDHRLSFAARGIRFSGDPQTPTIIETSICKFGDWCGSGETGIFSEFTKLTSDRAIRERKAWLNGPDAKSLVMYAIRMVELTIAYGPKDVGGPIDALTLSRNGVITWVRRKSNCPLTSD